MFLKRFITSVSVVLAGALLVACSDSPKRAPAIGEAFVGPAILKIRRDIAWESPTVATAKHGERLELLQRRRRLFRVRTSTGAEGWTDERQLLASSDMTALRQLSEHAAKMPSQGVATTYGDLNVHTQPARSTPSFLQVKENDRVNVLTHVITPRSDVQRAPLIPPAPKKTKIARKPKRQPKYPPLPMPKPPAPPENWVELSRTDSEEPPEPEPEAREKPAEPTDDWSLIRTHSGQSGWVLTRRLVMAIPDEVAQYAEGRRIVSYFPLGFTQDGDAKKATWLWTTIGKGSEGVDFDSFRVFIWSLRRHRYETAYIERNISGYAPVLLQEVELSSSARGRTDTAKYPGFSLCMEKKDGQRYRREYALLGNVVRLAGERACEAQTPEQVNTPAPLPVQEAHQERTSEGFIQRLKQRFKALTHWQKGS